MSERDKIFNFDDYIEIIFKNIFKIMLVTALFLCYWLYSHITSTRIYEVQSMIQVETESAKTDSIDSLLTGSKNTVLDEQILIYKSRTNFKELIENLAVNVKIEGKHILTDESIVDLLSYSIFDIEKNKIDASYYLRGDENTLQILNSEKVLLFDAEFEQDFFLHSYKLNFSKGALFKDNNDYLITFKNIEDEILYLQNQINVTKVINERFIESTLLNVSMLTSDIEMGQNIINEANNIFEAQSTKANSVEAANSITYLNLQIESYEAKLKFAEKELNQFMTENSSVDFNLEARGLFDESVSISQQKKEVELRLAEVANKFKANNPLYINLKSQLDFLELEEKRILSEVESLPINQQEFVRLTRDVEINKTFLESLLNSRLEFSLREASTLSNLRIIDDAYKTRLVSPRLLRGFLTYFVSGIFLSAIYFIFYQIFFAPILSPAQITRSSGSNVIGIIPRDEDEDDDGGVYKESFASIASNLELTMNKETCKTIMIVGPSPKVGKTLTSFNIGKSFSDRGKKTAVLDCDFKRGDLELLSSTPKMSSSDFNNVDIEKFKVSDNFYCFPRPKGKADKALFIFESVEFSNFIADLKNQFDYIILDTPPVLSVPDTLSLIKFCDRVVPVARHNFTKLDELSRTIEVFKNIGADISQVIYNDFKASGSYYGYDPYLYRYYSYKSYDYKPSDN